MKRAFEVEIIATRQTYVILQEDEKVHLYDTTPGKAEHPPRPMVSMPEDLHPEDEELWDMVKEWNASIYYERLRTKSLNNFDRWERSYLGRVNPDTFEPLEP